MLRNKNGHLFIFLIMFILLIGLLGCGEQKDEGTPGEAANGQNTQPQKSEDVSADELLVKAMEIDGFSYEYVLTMPSGEKFVHKMWVKEGNMRSEMENPFNTEPTLSIVSVTDKAVYIYQPDLKQAIAMPLDEPSVDTTSPTDYLVDLSSDDMVYMKHETFDGKECLVYETPDGKMWIWEEYGMPLRVELQSEEGTVLVEFLNFKIGEVDDSLFELPEGTQIVDLGALMAQ